MKIAYFDCFSGASGDMILGALIDAGLSPASLKRALNKIKIPTVKLQVRKVLRGGLSGRQVIVEGRNEKKSHRDLKELLKIVDTSGLDAEVREKAGEIFHRIASVEAGIHRSSVDEIHFHEVGGLDSVVDIVGAVWAIREMGIEKIYVSKVNVGSGFVKCEHGILPVPAPATLALMKGKPIYSSGVERELLTPTGAAILTTLGSEFGVMPSLRVESIGYGAGRDELPHPNLLRLILGTQSEHAGKEKVAVIETNIDDMNPQFYDYVMEKLFGMGAQEVFLTPILMKKNRPATLITIICSIEKKPFIADFLLRETTTLGLRWREEEREKAEREIVTLQTKNGKIRFKLARWEGKAVNLSPEYDDCKKLALATGASLKEVFEEARKEAANYLSNSKSTRARSGS